MTNHLPKAALNALQFEEKKLPNGLVLRVLPMPDYHSVHVIYATGFGSIHRAFEQAGKVYHLPAGIAHFLEHKMFENQDGVDAFTLYAETGAMANAYTGFDRTSYIFTASDQIDKNLDILLSLVGKPYFSQETVAKEQGIIGQEIKMYEDNPDTRLYYTMLASLYQQHPIREEIVGSVESIAEITPEMLYACCEAFYVPAGMAISAAGNITMAQLEAAVTRAGLPQEPAAPVTQIFPAEPEEVTRKHHEFSMEVAMPMLALGFKEIAPEFGTTKATKTEVICDILTEVLCGETSSLYRKLYDEGLVQPGFGADYGSFKDSLHFAFIGETEQPEVVRQAVLDEIERVRTQGIDREQFATVKNMMYGASIADMENVERMASNLSSSYFRGRTPAEELEAIVSVTAEDVEAALSTMLQEENSATVILRPSH